MSPEDRGIPIQFGPGLETIWPSAALNEYEAQWDVLRERVYRAPDMPALESVWDESVQAYRKARSRVPMTESHHIEYLFKQLKSEIDMRWRMDFFVMERQSRPSLRNPNPLPPVIEQLARQQRSDALTFLEQYNRTPIGNSAAASLGGIIAGAKIIEPEPYALLKRRAGEQIQYGQGMTRGYSGGFAIGRHPGYL